MLLGGINLVAGILRTRQEWCHRILLILLIPYHSFPLSWCVESENPSVQFVWKIRPRARSGVARCLAAWGQ